MKKILLLTDFSDTARNAAMYALKMFEDSEPVFYLLNVYDVEFSGSPYIVQVEKELKEESLKNLEVELKLIRRRFPLAKVELLSIFGAFIDVLKSEEVKNRYDLIVVGCRGESVLENFLLGSRAYEVVRSIDSPVLLVPKHAKFKRPEKIVFATDLKDIESDELVAPVREIAEMFHVPLLFVNVLDEESVNRISAEAKIASHFKDLSLTFNFVDDESVLSGINKFAEDNDAEIVALVRHNLGVIDRLFHPSLTKQMVMNPEHPMLILHEHTH